jgi:predicted TIM-barrel fold metal-dependent hydrolase
MSQSSLNLAFFDANVMVGRWPTYSRGSFCSLHGLAEEMERCRITESLVFHSLAKEYNPEIGNQELLKELGDDKRFHPCWVLVPHQTKEIPNPTSMVEQMLKMGVRAVRIFPLRHNFSISRCVLGELLAVLEDHRIPLLIDFTRELEIYNKGGTMAEWHEIAEVCSEYRELPVILIRQGAGQNRSLYALLEKLDNLHLEISYYFGHRGIEHICENLGAEHLIYGTGMPVFSAGPPTMLVTYAMISDADKRLIAGDNLRRLVKEVR